VNSYGEWVALSAPSWHCGLPYRVSPSWPGPAKPEPKPEYVDRPVVLVGEAYRFAQPGEDVAHWLIAVAPGLVGFVGYVYATDGRQWCSSALIFDKQDDGTHRLRVPKAVRFLKGAVA